MSRMPRAQGPSRAFPLTKSPQPSAHCPHPAALSLLQWQAQHDFGRWSQADVAGEAPADDGGQRRGLQCAAAADAGAQRGRSLRPRLPPACLPPSRLCCGRKSEPASGGSTDSSVWRVISRRSRYALRRRRPGRASCLTCTDCLTVRGRRHLFTGLIAGATGQHNRAVARKFDISSSACRLPRLKRAFRVMLHAPRSVRRGVHNRWHPLHRAHL